MRRTGWLSSASIAALGAFACGCGSTSSSGRSPEDTSPATLIAAFRGDSFRVGPYSLAHVFKFERGAPTSLADVEAKLGHDDSCTGTGNEAKVVWPRLGIVGGFATLGAYSDPNGKAVVGSSASGCRYRTQIAVDRLTASHPHWHTPQGLRIGDPLSRLLRLYPRAVQDDQSWWLHTYKSPFGGGTEADMIARIVDGSVVSLTVSIGAEGD